MKNYKKLLAGSMALLMTLGAAGCSNTTGSGTESSASSSSDDNGLVVLNVAATNQPVSFDPADANLVVNEYTQYDCYDTLLDFNAEGTDVVPALAESWEQVDDVTYTYKIREGVKFSDGSDLTMEDILYSLNRVTEDGYGMSYLFEFVDHFEVDEATRTLTVHLTQPDSTWKYVPATTPCQILKKSVVEAEGDNYGTNEGSVVGTGPYKFVSWASDSQIVLEKNEYWWGGADNLAIDKINFYVMKDASTIALAVKSGTIDFAPNLTSEVMPTYKSLENYNIIHGFETATSFVALNTQVAPFDDVNARKALAYCIDSSLVQQSIGGEYSAKLDVTCLSENMYYMDPDKWHTAVSEMEDYTVQDYDKAKEYLAKSAYPDGFEFDYYTPASGVTQAELIQSMLGDVGITMNIKEVLTADMFSYLYGFNADEQGHRPYQAFGSSWVSDYLDPVGNLKTMFHSANTAPGCANQAMWTNSEFDALIDKSYATTDDNERLGYFIEASKIAADECAYIPLYAPESVYALSSKFSYVPSPQSFWNFTYADFTVNE
ncbi:ABC transporter substrate-binding protein [uncultured Ruminococcus sp.]|uniref:ABC transporter substrate-binding protein n=1 Tax=uncultured Ruminococcus sp. TaxID=165186 RepID=UPI0025CE3987|nr:ABC transporter substrate-binding protein [uncultured Ruminococcus sp.]